MLFNMQHAGVRRLNQHDANTKPGLWLHQFGWLKDAEIGELPAEWNVLIGSTNREGCAEPLAVHFTNGTPDIQGHENDEFSDEWRAYELSGYLSPGHEVKARIAA